MSKYKYMREDIEDSYGVLPLQDKILEIMVYLDGFCKEHGITYYLMGGSALGGMRHGGFIPWDDDLDIFMPYADYCKFIKCCETDLDKENFYFQKEDTKELPHFFSKLRRNGTTCMEEVNKGRKDMHQGIFVDIMCLNNAAKGKCGKKMQYYAAGLLKARAVSKTNYKAKGFKKKMQMLIAKIFVNGPIKKWLLHIVRKHNKKPSAEVAHLFGRAKFSNSFYKASNFAGQRWIDFEKVQLAAPIEVEEYLRARYGENYMQLPDENTKALYASHAMIWDVNKDYTEYLEEKV